MATTPANTYQLVVDSRTLSSLYASSGASQNPNASGNAIDLALLRDFTVSITHKIVLE